MATATQTARLYDRLIDAEQTYAHDNSDGFTNRDWSGAKGYREEGYRLGKEAHDLPADDREDFIDDQAAAFPGSAQYLVAVAASYRLAELVARDNAYSFNADMAA